MAESRVKDCLREATELRRSEQKERRLLSRRGVRGEWDAVPLQEVPLLASQIKRKTPGDAAEALSRLQKAFLDSADAVAAFLAVPGAFNALVGHLSGMYYFLQFLF
jgi:hypothetical protein